MQRSTLSLGIIIGIVSFISSLKPAHAVYITELLPNPSGEDYAKEWIELYNPENTIQNMKNWSLNTLNISFPIRKDILIKPKSYLLLNTKKTHITLHNKKETVTLYDSEKKIVQTITYEKAPQGKSYALNNGVWGWTLPTPALTNYIECSPKQCGNYEHEKESIALNEVLPSPEKEKQEWIELYNPHQKEVNLTGWQIKDTKTTYTFPKDASIEAQGYLVLEQKVTKITLNNTRDKITLVNEQGETIDTTPYNHTIKSKSYSKMQSGKWIWTKETPREKNMELAEFSGIIETEKDNIFTLKIDPIDQSKKSIESERFIIEKNSIIPEAHKITFLAFAIYPHLWQVEEIKELIPIEQKSKTKHVKYLPFLAIIIGIGGIITAKKRMQRLTDK